MLSLFAAIVPVKPLGGIRMKIGTVRPEEARVFDRDEGYHQFHSEDGSPYGSFEVFWHNGGPLTEGMPRDPEDWDSDDSEQNEPAGWYWYACFPGCLPDSDPSGPFATSTQAMYDADEFHPDHMEE